MSNNKLIFAAIIAVVLLIAGTFVILEYFGPPRVYLLDFSGKPGMEVVGYVDEDGVKTDMKLTLPTQVKLRGKHISFAFVARDPALDREGLRVKVNVDGAHVTDVTVSSVTTWKGLRGQLHRPRLLTSLRGNLMFRGNTPEEIAQIRK